VRLKTNGYLVYLMVDRMKKRKKKIVTLCCGGGIDSTALIQWYLDNEFMVQGIHFDYGQPACAGERKSLEKISEFYQIRFDFCKIHPIIPASAKGEYPGRNSIFIFAAINHFEQSKGLISLGIHANTDFYDCTERFVGQMRNLLDGYFGGTIVLNMPFLNFSKEDIINYCNQANVPTHLTYSCQKNPDQPCGKCNSCLERIAYGIDQRDL
jgi:7-cyano-7-deazaguanine synthase